jgi:hypothetical protein
MAIATTMRFFLVLALVLVTAAAARADTCGDADDSGAVTVTDGVQTLRAAAGLDSSCTAARCDVDGSGAVSVTDGVNVLRAAAGLAVTFRCPGAQPTCTSAAVTVALAAPKPIGAATLTLGYAANVVALPGSGDAASDRVTVASPGTLLGNGQPNDLEDRVVFSLVAFDGVDDGNLLTVTFDCLGAAPGAGAFSCDLKDVFATDGLTAVTGASCAVTVDAE